MGVMGPQAKGCLRPPKTGRGKKGPPLEFLEGARLFRQQFQTLASINGETVNSPCSKPAACSHVSAAMGNS